MKSKQFRRWPMVIAIVAQCAVVQVAFSQTGEHWVPTWTAAAQSGKPVFNQAHRSACPSG